jgi:hypothetical protein
MVYTKAKPISSKAKRQLTKVFAIAGLDGRTIGSKALVSFSYQGYGILFGKRIYLEQ